MTDAESASLSDNSAERVAEIEGRLAATLGGPWESFIEGRDHRGGDSFIRTAVQDVYVTIDYLSADPHEGRSAAYDALQDFIAHARQDIPWLIEQLRSAQSSQEVSD